jgi:hypothetical protein
MKLHRNNRCVPAQVSNVGANKISLFSCAGDHLGRLILAGFVMAAGLTAVRSEERRVGKECTG